MVDMNSFDSFNASRSEDREPVFLEQYVQDVVGFSSQYGSDISISYTAYNITGKPSKFPDYGDFPQAFVMRTYGNWWNEAPSRTRQFMPQSLGKIKSQDFIDLQFEEDVYPFRVSVYETYNPGSVVRIWASTTDRGWQLLWEGEPQRVGHTPRVFSPIDIPNSIVNFLDQELPQLLNGTEDLAQTSSTKSEGFDCLPNETVLKIFGYLSLQTLCRCAQVNRRFRELATDSLLYTELNLKVYWYCITNKSLYYLSKRCQFLQKLDMSWCGDFMQITPDNFINFIEECGSQLTHLRLNSCKFVDNSCILKVAENCNNLKELGLRNCQGIGEYGYRHLSRLKNLQYLDLYRTLVDLLSLKAILKQSQNLKHINMGSCVHISSMDDIALTLAMYNKELVSVDFWKTYSLTPVGVRALRKCKKLEEVDLGVGAPGDSLNSLASGCPRLRKLFLAALRGVTDRDLEPFIEHCPLLEQVDLLG
ncbi:F-box/LRR-repeat protein 4, partial [Blattella germanica]